MIRTVLKWRRVLRSRLRVKLTGKLYLNDLFELKDFHSAIEDGYIRVQKNRAGPLSTVGYTEKAQFDRVWNDVTLTCRGLIYRTDTGQIVARPMPKFFNHNQPEAPSIGLGENVSVTDKADGSLGILYRCPSGSWAIATRGSFHSEQAEHATKLFNEKYAGWEPADHLTYVFEIIYPANRIVCNYGDMDDLVLLGAIGINSGVMYGPKHIPAGEFWPGPRTEVFECESYADALAMPPRDGKEGIVIRTFDGRMQKIKQADYIALHRIVTGLNARAVWQLMVDGKSIEDFIENIPDEFHGWVSDVYSSIEDDVNETVGICERAFTRILEAARDIPEYETNKKKAFALLAKDHNMKGYLFMLYDGKNITGEVLKNAKPAADWTPVRVPDEAAA